MPRPHAAGTGRTTGSWTPRLAGISAALLVAGGGAIAYLIAGPANASRGPGLPTRVLSVQTVGIVAQGSGGPATARLLTDSPHGVLFGAMPPADQPQGNPQWTADTMAGGTYVFIYAPDGKCLASAAGRRRTVLALRRCDLGPDQRWRQVNGTTVSAGHQYGQYRNLGSGRCLTAGGAAGQAVDPARLAPCDPASRAGQRVSFWWSA
jgi:Ricin-type beta-trefoil lectin domain-like